MVYEDENNILGSIGNQEAIRVFVQSPVYEYMINWSKIKKEKIITILLLTVGDSELHALRGEAFAMDNVIKLLDGMKEIAFPKPQPHEIKPDDIKPDWKRSPEMIEPIKLESPRLDSANL